MGNELRRIFQHYGTEEAVLDFGMYMGDETVNLSVAFDREFMGLTAALGIGLEVSIYKAND